MAQIKLALCLCLGLVGLVAAQSANPTACQEKMQKQMAAYANAIRESVSSMTSKVSEQAQGAANINGMTEQADKIGAQLSKLTDTSNGFDLQQIMSVYSEIMASQAKFGSQMLNSGRAMDMMGLYFDFTTDMIRINRDMMAKVASACMPGRRHLY